MIRLTLVCDGCGGVSLGYDATPQRTRIVTRIHGWSTARGKYGRVLDYCPTCTTERAASLSPKPEPSK